MRGGQLAKEPPLEGARAPPPIQVWSGLWKLPLLPRPGFTLMDGGGQRALCKEACAPCAPWGAGERAWGRRQISASRQVSAHPHRLHLNKKACA